MKKPLQIGDRVRIYGFHELGDGTPGVIGLLDGGFRSKRVRVDFETGHFPFIWAHPKQLRRLVKKQRREFWVVLDGHGEVFTWSKEKPKMGEFIHVVEVRK